MITSGADRICIMWEDEVIDSSDYYLSVTYQDALQPVVEVPHEEDSTAAPSGQTDFLQTVVVTGHLHTVIQHLTDQ